MASFETEHKLKRLRFRTLNVSESIRVSKTKGCFRSEIHQDSGLEDAREHLSTRHSPAFFSKGRGAALCNCRRHRPSSRLCSPIPRGWLIPSEIIPTTVVEVSIRSLRKRLENDRNGKTEHCRKRWLFDNAIVSNQANVVDRSAILSTLAWDEPGGDLESTG